MDNGICGFNMIPEYNTSLRFMEGVNLLNTIKMEGINTIYLDLINRSCKAFAIIRYPRNSNVLQFFNYLRIRKVLLSP